MKESNVFSEMPEKITMLVYTQSFLGDKDSFLYFNNADLLRSIRIRYMPLLDKHGTSLPIETGYYKHTPDENEICTSIEFSDCAIRLFASSIFPPQKTEDELNELAETYILHNRLNNIFDYIIASDVWCEEHEEHDNIVSYSEAKDILRLFLIQKKDFEMINNFYVDESLYYLYKYKELFQEFQNFWNSILQDKNDADINTANALSNRLLLFSMCMDNASIEAYKPQNNITAMHIKYHISYLLLLVTGSFDSLAWLINNLYGMGFEIKMRTQIDLINKKFRKGVEQKSSLLYDLLSESVFINQIEAIRELRDRIVHRDFIGTISSGEGAKRKNYLWIDQIASDKLLKAGFDEKWYIIKIGDHNAIDILSFLKYVQKVTINIVNRFLKEISMEIYHSNTQYSIAKLLHLPEPFVL